MIETTFIATIVRRPNGVWCRIVTESGTILENLGPCRDETDAENLGHDWAKRQGAQLEWED